jgi:hypothetical protein
MLKEKYNIRLKRLAISRPATAPAELMYCSWNSSDDRGSSLKHETLITSHYMKQMKAEHSVSANKAQPRWHI